MRIIENQAEYVRLIFRLYVDGDIATDTPPLGTKNVVEWMNSRGYRTQNGKPLTIAYVGRILKNTAYIGEYVYNKRNSRTGERRPDSEWITVPCPPIIDKETFNRAREKARDNVPAKLNSRSSSSPVLLSRLAICGKCGGSMQKSTGSGDGGVYHYYACSTQCKKGSTECQGVRIRMDELDESVIETVSTHLCTTDRLTIMLNGLMQHLSNSAASASANLAAAQKALDEWDGKLKRLHKSIEDGLVPLDEVLRERIFEISGEREHAKKQVERLRKQLTPSQEINHQHIETFSRTLRERLKEGNPVLRRNYLKSVIGAVVVEADQVRIVGHKPTLAGQVTAFSFAPEKVHTFGTNWRTPQDETENSYVIVFSL